MPLVRIRPTQPSGHARWLESILPAGETDLMVWSTDPAAAVLAQLPHRPIQGACLQHAVSSRLSAVCRENMPARLRGGLPAKCHPSAVDRPLFLD
jgi:hypothetical protein